MRSVIMILGLAFLLSGCAAAQLEKETKDGGRVVVYGARGVAADKGIKQAQETMSKKCPNGYDVIEEGWQGSGVTMYGGGLATETQAKYFEFKCKTVQ